MEYVPKGDLGTLINTHGPLPEMTVKTMAEQLLSALKCLHENNITHRDVKPDNILIQSEDPIIVKLTDFGLSKMRETEETFMNTFCGTLLYCAPEVYSEYREYDSQGRRSNRRVDKKSLPPQPYGHAVDIWSLAGVLFFCLCASPPYPAKNGISYQDLLHRIMTTALDIRPLQRVEVSEAGIRFIRRMLHIKPHHRATIKELEESSWFTGESIEMSMEDIGQIGGFVVEVEEGTSQLSLADEPEIRDSLGGDSATTELHPREARSSFDTSDDSSNGDSNVIEESYNFIRNHAGNGNGNGRLFGEVNVNNSALGSSGAIPFSQVHLPEPVNHLHAKIPQSEYSQSQPDMESSQSNSELSQPFSRVPPVMPPPPLPKIVTNLMRKDAEDRNVRSSSLMGAESLVGQLQMNSPAATSPAENEIEQSTEAPTPWVRDLGISLRRQREEEPIDDDDGWKPADLPPTKRRKSDREIDIPVPPSIFWDPRDKSTHHNNYPAMSISEFHNFREYAESKGEKFLPGGKTFEMTMQSFRGSSISSGEPESFVRAQSDPVIEEGRRRMMKRDERTLIQQSAVDAALPRTARGSDIVTTGTATEPNSRQGSTEPLVGNDFQAPKRILAKFLATNDSCLPTIALNITEHITTWGRGIANTHRYVRFEETRVPKYAFKLLLFKPSFYSTATGLRPKENDVPWSNKTTHDQDFTFYISSKASQGILVNGVHVPSFEPQNPYSASKFWGEIRHGDVVTVWRTDKGPKNFTQFRFECFWGKSKERRAARAEFEVLGDGKLLTEIERVCVACEKEVFEAREKKEEEEILRLEKEKLRG